MFWVWRGDYMNLGPGAELGIYFRDERNDLYLLGYEHWEIDSDDLTFPMGMKLAIRNMIGKYSYYEYNPSEQQWWITSFVVERASVFTVGPDRIAATFWVDFTGREGMYNAFRTSPSYNINEYWTFNDNNHRATLTFGEERSCFLFQ